MVVSTIKLDLPPHSLESPEPKDVGRFCTCKASGSMEHKLENDDGFVVIKIEFFAGGRQWSKSGNSAFEVHILDKKLHNAECDGGYGTSTDKVAGSTIFACDSDPDAIIPFGDSNGDSSDSEHGEAHLSRIQLALKLFLNGMNLLDENVSPHGKSIVLKNWGFDQLALENIPRRGKYFRAYEEDHSVNENMRNHTVEVILETICA